MKKYSGITFSLATGLCGLAAQISPHNPAAKEFFPWLSGWVDLQPISPSSLAAKVLKKDNKIP